MSRAGRKRKHQQKHNGIPIVPPEEAEAKREGYYSRSPNEVARSQPHRMRLFEDLAHDPRCETSLGQLNLIGAIPNDLYAAGQRLARVVRRWREVVDAPRPAPSIAGVGQPTGVAGSDIEDAKERQAAYNDAIDSLAASSKTARAITLWVVVDGGRVPANGFRPLMDGLRALRDARQ